MLAVFKRELCPSLFSKQTLKQAYNRPDHASYAPEHNHGRGIESMQAKARDQETGGGPYVLQKGGR